MNFVYKVLEVIFGVTMAYGVVILLWVLNKTFQTGHIPTLDNHDRFVLLLSVVVHYFYFKGALSLASRTN